MSSFIYKILFDKQKPLYYNSITVISYKLLPLLFKDAAKNFLIHLPRYIETIPKVILKPFV